MSGIVGPAVSAEEGKNQPILVWAAQIILDALYPPPPEAVRRPAFQGGYSIA
jgi:hypothetical protein